MKTLISCLLGGAVILFSAQPFTSAQVSNGARRGYSCTHLDWFQIPVRVYRIDLDNPGATVEMGLTGGTEQLEGFFSIDNFSVTGRSNLFGVSETPDGTEVGGPSILADITATAVSPSGRGAIVGETGVNFGYEVGAAYDHLSNKAYAIFSDDRVIINDDPSTPEVEGQDFPATKLVVLDPTDGNVLQEFEVNTGLPVDGLAVGGDGTLYATDTRNTDRLYKYNFDFQLWEEVNPTVDGTLLAEEDFSADSGLANYRGVGGNETNLYMITDHEHLRPARLWMVSHLTGQATLVGNITFPGGAEVPENLEGFDIPYQPLVGEQ